MNKVLLALTFGLLIAGMASAENHTTDDGAGSGMMDDGDEAFDYTPIITLVVVSAVVFLVAKYGP